MRLTHLTILLTGISLILTGCLSEADKSENELRTVGSGGRFETVSLSSAWLEEGGTVTLNVMLKEIADDSTHISISLIARDSSRDAVDAGRVEMRELVIPEGQRSGQTELRLARDQIQQLDTQIEVGIVAGSDESRRVDLDLVLLNVAPDSLLYLFDSGYRQYFFEDPSPLMRPDGAIRFEHLETDWWPLPDDPTWSEDPFQYNSWSLYYQSLTFLAAYASRFDATNDSTYIDLMLRLVLDYMQTNLDREHPASPMTWHDHAASVRSTILAYLYHKYLHHLIDGATDSRLRAFLFTHGEFLSDELDNPKYWGHNHAFIHAQALWNLTFAFPSMTADTDWRSQAKTRLEALFNEMVDSSGVSTEQSISYQYNAINLFEEARTQARRMKSTFHVDVGSRLTKSLEFSAISLYPDGTAPALGDTPYDQRYDAELAMHARRTHPSSPIVEYVLTQGASGSAPDRISVFEGENYVVLRPGVSSKDVWVNQSMVFIDLGRSLRIHGHHDATTFMAYIAGEKLLVDTGGPYSYEDTGRELVRPLRQGNALVVDGYESIDKWATIEKTYDEPQFIGATGQLDQRGVRHIRTIGLLHEQILIVVDHLVPADDSLHAYEAFLHYPSASSIASREDGFRITTQTGRRFEQFSASSAPLETSVVEGQEGNRPMGWVVTAPRTIVAAPVTTVAWRSSGPAWLVTVVAPQSLVGSPITEENEEDGDLTISILGDTLRYSTTGQTLTFGRGSDD